MIWKQNEKVDDVYIDAVNKKRPLNGNKCPVCNSGTLHIYVHIFEGELAKGKDWIKSSGWIWCDNCHCWDHFRGTVPGWWEKIEPLKIESDLDLPPDKLCSHTAEIDKRNQQIEAHF